MTLSRFVRSEKRSPRNLLAAVRASASSETIFASWSASATTKDNFGDALNPVLIRALSGRPVYNARAVANLSGKPVHAVIGSVLDNIGQKDLIVWGAGFKRDGATVQRAPARICAVRGPLTRRNLEAQGIACPEIYGDPALLCPRFFPPSGRVTHELGIVAHYADQHHPVLGAWARSTGVAMIDVRRPVGDVVAQITACERIASSSLHGLIVADSYGIPTAWLKLSDRLAGGSFKFMDYAGSVGFTDYRPIEVGTATDLRRVTEMCELRPLDVDVDALVAACPFLSSSPRP